MERIACGADSEVNYPSNHHFSRFSFSFWRTEGSVAFQGVGWGDETVALGKALSWTGRELVAQSDGILYSAQRGLSSDGITVFAHVALAVLEPSPPKFRSLASCFFHPILRCPLQDIQPSRHQNLFNTKRCKLVRFLS